MGNYMYLEETRFHIGRDKEEGLRSVLAEETQAVVESDGGGERATKIVGKAAASGQAADRLSLDDLCECWGWSLLREHASDTGEITGVELLEDYPSDEEAFFDILAPFVTGGSYITLSGTSSAGDWETRYGFTGSRVVDLERGDYPPVPVDGGSQRDERRRGHQPWSYRGRSPLLIKAAAVEDAPPPGTKYYFNDAETGKRRWTQGKFVAWTAKDSIFPEHSAVLVSRTSVQFIPESALLPPTRELLPRPPEDARAYGYGAVAPGVG